MDNSVECPVEERFLKGVAISVWQNSSDTDSNWAHFAKARNYFGQADLVNSFLESSDFWNKYEHDIELAKKTGATSFRFSFEWARFEPRRGEWDQAAFDTYHNILSCCEKHGLIPMATLHHFTHPQWFEEMGSFTTEENIPIFVEYVKKVFGAFGSRIKLWGTFNEPTCYAFCGYVGGLWCPGKMGQFSQCGTVLFNLLRAHVAAYHAIKAMPGGKDASVGIVHQHIRFLPKTRGLPLLWVRPLTEWMTYLFGSEVMLNFFKTGYYEWRAPMRGVVVKGCEATAPDTVDWWGINYYTRPAIGALFTMEDMEDKAPLTDMSFPIVPEDLYHHITCAAELRAPIYITETGLADRKDTMREPLIKSYYQEILRAIKDGYDVRGVYYWTLMDNIEWHHGFRMKFGLYEFDPVQRRNAPIKLRAGSRALVDIHNAWPDTLTDLRRYAEDHMYAPVEGLKQCKRADLMPKHASTGSLASLGSKTGSHGSLEGLSCSPRGSPFSGLISAGKGGCGGKADAADLVVSPTPVPPVS